MRCKFVTAEKAWFWGESTFCFGGKVYTFYLKGIYYLPEGYIPFARRVYTICPKGIYHLLEGYIPFA